MQVSLDDDELFSEASEEIEKKVEQKLKEARSSLPNSDSIMETDGENIIGVLNSFKSELEVENEESLKEAMKWFEVGKRAGSFDEDFRKKVEEELNYINNIIKSIEEVRQKSMQLTDSIAELRKSL